MDEITIYRDGTLPLRFEGEELATASSEAPGKPRWFVVTIYRTVNDEPGAARYVVHGVGVSDVEGEEDRHWAVACANADEVIEALRRDGADGVRFLPRTSQYALEEATQLDDGLRGAYVATI